MSKIWNNGILFLKTQKNGTLYNLNFKQAHFYPIKHEKKKAQVFLKGLQYDPCERRIIIPLACQFYQLGNYTTPVFPVKTSWSYALYLKIKSRGSP